MKSKTLRLAPALALILICLVACQAQVDTILNKEALIKAVSADPLLTDLRNTSSMRKDLIASGSVDLYATSSILEASSQHPCELTADVSDVEGGAEYVRLLCDYVTTKQALFDKYPNLTKLSSAERAAVLNAKKSLSVNEAEELIRLNMDPK